MRMFDGFSQVGQDFSLIAGRKTRQTRRYLGQRPRFMAAKEHQR